GSSVDVLKLENFSLLVSRFEGDKAPVTRENALAHAAVVRSILSDTTPLPFRFGTVTDEQRLRHFVASHQQALETKLAHVRGCVEMSVKIIWSPDEADVDSGSEGPGARFLRDKQLRAAKAKDVAAWLKEQLHAFVKDEQMTLGATEKLIVAAAHLVERGAIAQYRDQLGEARKLRPELHFLVSGPWPPYSFSNIDLEFKTLFGVN
ncbi:MAG TPA: GvpL/GvpF family gas vesicle protein, partial [Pyrinomonadaceae bacterium]|nr:GvpL/GvpF family gas vesicle protein [Pyrinomonadaceae bacterium]